MLQDKILVEYIEVLSALSKAIEKEDTDSVERLVKREKELFETYGDELLETEGFLEALSMRKEIMDKLERKVEEIFLRIKRMNNSSFPPSTSFTNTVSIYIDETA